MGKINIQRILEKLDEYFASNDTAGAKRHLEYWLAEAEALFDKRGIITIANELIGLHRKCGDEEKALKYCRLALEAVKGSSLANEIAGATTYINCGTAYKAFGKAEKAIPFFEEARKIYERELPDTDGRLGGLYNNTALALVDLKEYKKANELYMKALSVMEKVPRGELERAVTYLNMASAAEAEKGLTESEEIISEFVNKAWELLNIHKEDRDGYYAFVCEKCASVFGYYGYFLYERELSERAKRIYERN
ncbi:MAG: tetratricopeptide repeat protein [Ruminococcaceae bacterium]|nr:tetratricopeptide repeat protein [Oscillospiraceae bacterium]